MYNQNYPKSTPVGFFLGSEERVRNSLGKRVISFRATEILLHLLCYKQNVRRISGGQINCE